jgi:hypothetical protein
VSGSAYQRSWYSHVYGTASPDLRGKYDDQLKWPTKCDREHVCMSLIIMMVPGTS